MILDPTDQRIRDAGFNFVPFDRYLASPFQAPNTQFTDPNTGTGVMSVLPTGTMRSGGGRETGFDIDDRGLIATGSFNEDTGKFEIPNVNFDAKYSYTPPAYDDFPPQQNIFQKALGSLKDTVKDKAAPIFGGILSAATGIPFLGQGLQAITNQFENRPLGAAVIDEFGNVYDEEELNQQNALGGYYSEAARSARRRTNRINKMLERQRLGKVISIKNLQKLQAQEKKQEEIRQAAARAMQDRNRAEGRGGYQAGYSKDFMEGGGERDAAQESRSPGSSGPGGSDTMGSFMDGGIVDLVDIYD